MLTKNKIQNWTHIENKQKFQNKIKFVKNDYSMKKFSQQV